MQKEKPSRSFTQLISQKFGKHASTTISRYMSSNKKLAKLISKRIFLLRCKTLNIIPNHIIHICKHINTNKNNSPFAQKFNNIQRRTENSLLNLEIEECHYMITNMENYIAQISNKLTTLIPDDVLQKFTLTQEKHFKNINSKSNNTLKQKFARMKENQPQNIDFIFDEDCIKNISNTVLPLEAIITLSLGPKFNMPTDLRNRNNALELIAATENAINDIPDIEIRNQRRKLIAHEIQRHIQKHKNNKIDNFLIYCERTTKRFFKENPDIYKVRSDKGNVTVVMTKKDYLDKMKQLINDESTYTSIDIDPTPRLQRKNNRLVLALENKHYINKLKRKQLSTDTATCPRLYGLPKIHKPNTPMRPVISNINSPSYSLAKFMCNILQIVNKDSAYNIKSTDDLITFLSEAPLKTNDILVSFDVESLYTNVDIDLALTVIESKWENIEKVTPIDKYLFKEIIRFCVVECNYFSYENHFYKQKYGLAMGNPLSGLLAEMTLDHIIDQALKTAKDRPTFTKKYVDDILCAVPQGSEENLLETFNSIHKRFHFTIEKEIHKSIPFLDVKLIRTDDQTILTDWYRKPCSSNRILNYYSNHPHNTKINTAQTYVNKIIKISNKQFLSRNIQIATDILTKNNYPTNITNSIIKRAVKLKHFGKPQPNKNNKPILENAKPFYSSIPYIHPISQKIAKLLKMENGHMKIAFKPINRLEKIYTKTKDSLPTQEKSGIVYEVKCDDCDVAYIGQTSKKLKTRLSQHKTYINKKTPKSALASHSLNTKHIFSFDNAKIIDTESSKKKREIKEACHIYINKNNIINLRQDTEIIDKEYKYILNNLK